jgi:putative transposase
VKLLATARLKVKRQRQDIHHKTAPALVRVNDTINHEDVQTANPVRNHHLAKSIQDAGWAQILSILSDKAACAGRSVVAVNPAFTSQTCSGYGVLVAKGPSVRWHNRPDCGTSLHRDHNAAKNIERLGQARRGPWRRLRRRTGIPSGSVNKGGRDSLDNGKSRAIGLVEGA